jgi:methionine sulfoxide reductase heme-binding subunit
VTSTAGWIRKLGGKRWARLHQLVYVAAILGVIHYDWLVESNKTRPLIYGGILTVLLLWRLGKSMSTRLPQPSTVPPPA